MPSRTDRPSPRKSGLLLLLPLLLTPALVALTGCPQVAPKTSPQALPQIRTVTAAEREQYAGNEACAQCHAKLFAAHRDSQHAHALSRVDVAGHGKRFRHPSATADPDRGLKYETAVAGDRCVLLTRQEGRTSITPASYGFGSGKHAVTYMSDSGPELLELRLSYYADARKWDLSPGQQVKHISGGVLYPEGLVKDRDVVEGCFVCHSTAVVKQDGKVRPEQSIFGVGCESCHGPGRNHIAAAKRKDRDPRMASLSAQRDRLSRDLCGQCHRSPAGEDIHDPFNQTQMPRLQGLALSQSPCFTNSGGKLSCLTCHDPHEDAKVSLAGYNQQCGSCHSPATPTQRACALEPQGDCVSCHMPEQSVGMPTGLKYRTHWIKVWSGR